VDITIVCAAGSNRRNGTSSGVSSSAPTVPASSRLRRWKTSIARARGGRVRPAIHVPPPPGDVGPHGQLKALDQPVIPRPPKTFRK
jgi:hypothetical protein